MQDQLSRRKFLMLTGGTIAALIFKIHKNFLRKSAGENLSLNSGTSELAYYSTACRECPSGCGMLIWHRNGEIARAEGNPVHPINNGKLCFRGQSSVQGEYNSERLTKVLQKDQKRFIESSWETALRLIKKELASGKKPMVISDLQTGTLARLITDFTKKYNGPPPLFYEPFNYESMRMANAEMYDMAVVPRYFIKDCDLIVSIEASLLETWLSPVEYAKDYSNIHNIKENKIGKLIYVGPAETFTAISSDEFIKITPGTEPAIIYGIIHVLIEKNVISKRKYEGHFLPPSSIYLPFKQIVERIAEQIIKAKSPVILAGSPEDSSSNGKNTVKAANLLNEFLGNSKRIDFSQFHAISKSAYKVDVNNFFESITNEHILIIHNTNPSFSINEICDNIQAASTVVYIGSIHNETAGLANWILPSNYPVEDWGDFEPWRGTISLMQPVLRPVFDTKSAGDIFLELMEDGKPLKSFKEILQANWWSLYAEKIMVKNEKHDQNEKDTFDQYRKLLQKGTLTYKPVAKKPLIQPISFLNKEIPVLGQDEFFLNAFPSFFFYDGRLSNRSLLQEMPNPVSNITWQSWIDMNTKVARIKEIGEGDVLKVSNETGTLELIVRLTDKIAENTVSMEIGQGHWSFGHVADGIGVNAFSLLDIKNARLMPIVKVEKTGKKMELNCQNTTRE